MRSRAVAILPINIALLLVGLADLLTTLFWLSNGMMIEVNPVMASILKLGMPLFIAVKLTTLCAYVAVMEWYRRNRSEVFAKGVGVVTVTAYLGIYFVSFICVNSRYFLG